MTEQLELVPADVVALLPEPAVLLLRIAELEDELEQARRRGEGEKQRRLDAETSRDEWASIAAKAGVQRSQTRDLVDHRIAADAASRAADHTRRLLGERDRDLVQLRITAEALVKYVRLVPKLPSPLKDLGHDVKMALNWALFAHHHAVLPQPRLSPEQRAAVAKYRADWQAVLGYSQQQVHGGEPS